MLEEPVAFQSGGVALTGTLALPVGDAVGAALPGVVFIHGSGAVDRDENPDPELAGAHIRGIKLDVFRDLAEALAAVGIASLRYDKRGIGESGGDFNTRRVDDLVGDIAAAVATLRSDSRIDGDRIALLGHSEGGMLGPRVIADDPSIAGFVSCAGTVRNLKEILRHQSAGAIESAVADGADRVAVEAEHERSLAAIEESESVEDSMGWLRDWFRADSVATLRQVRCPVLVIQGDKDCQVPWACALEMVEVLVDAGNPDVELGLFANIDHLLKFEPGVSSAARYREGADRKTEPLVAKTIACWLQRVLDGEPFAVPASSTQAFVHGLSSFSTSVPPSGAPTGPR